MTDPQPVVPPSTREPDRSHDHAAETVATPAHDHAADTADSPDHDHADGAPASRPHVAAAHRHAPADDHEHDHDDGWRERLLHLIRPHGHDPASGFDSALESSQKGVRAVKVSLVALLATAIAQLLIVFQTGSTALLADTIHNFSDALTSVPLWIAFVIGRRAADRRYNYGYGRAEDLVGLFIVVMIALSALLVGWESIQRLFEPAEIVDLWLVGLAGFVGFLGNEAVALYRIRIGRQIGSEALIADGLHARSDGITSLAVVIAAVGVWLGFPLADPLIGLVITAVILWILRDAARAVFRRLMDAVDPELVDRIEHIAADVDGVLEVESVRVRWIGHRLVASTEIVVDCRLTVAQGHAISERVRHALFHEVRGLDTVLVHVDPCEHGASDSHAETRDHDETLVPVHVIQSD